MEADTLIRKQLKSFLQDQKAHVNFETAVGDFPEDKMNTLVPEIGYTAWQLLEHIRLAQQDILDFMKNPQYQPLKWPEGYWPSPAQKADQVNWDQSVQQVQKDLNTLQKMLDDLATDLYNPIPHADRYTRFREFLLIIDHNSYHVGQLVMLRKLLGVWK